MGRFRALASHDFRLLFFGQLVSLTGTQMQHVAVLWQLYVLTKSPVSLGLMALFRVLPVLMLAPLGGVVADAFDRRKLMLITQSALACASLILTFATLHGEISPPMIYAVLFFSGVAIAFDTPARQALLPELVDKDTLPNALSLHAMAWQLATIGGPAIAGIILATFGPLAIYLADVLSFVAVIGALLMMRHRGRSSTKSAISFRAAFEGLRFLRKAPLISSSMTLDFFATFFGGSILMLPFFAVDLLGSGADGLGFLYTAQPIGAALTSFILSSLPPIHRQGRVLILSVVLYGAAIAGFGLSPWMWLSFVMLAASGAADTVSMVIRQTIRQLNTPDELRGRMTSVSMLFFMGGPQLGELEAGLVAEWFGARFSVASGGVLCMVITLVIAAAVPVLRNYRHQPAPA
jgi:MFS family permease